MTGQRIFDADHRGDNFRFHLGALKCQVRLLHLTVDQLQVLTVAQGLGSYNLTVLKGYILTVPGQIFPFDGTAADHHIFRVPEGILCIKGAVLKHGILNVLEGIFSLQFHIPEVQML